MHMPVHFVTSLNNPYQEWNKLGYEKMLSLIKLLLLSYKINIYAISGEKKLL